MDNSHQGNSSVSSQPPGLEQQPLQRPHVPRPGISAQGKGKERKRSGILAEAVMPDRAALDVTGSGLWG